MNMRVYVAEEVYWDESGILGVYSTPEAAREEIARVIAFRKKQGWEIHSQFHVTTYEVDKGPVPNEETEVIQDDMAWENEGC